MLEFRLHFRKFEQVLSFSLFVLGVLLFWSQHYGFAGTIYYYKDEKGVLHFTDIPDSERYQRFFSFGEDLDVERSEILNLINKYSRVYGVDAQLVHAIVEIESGFKHRAQSSAGAQGLMQIMPETQKDLQIQRPFDPEVNIEAGIRYFRSMLDRFDYLPHALAAYNAGPSRVEQYSGIPPFPETQQYVEKVVGLYKKLKKVEYK